jgi:hypothetical protein
VFTFQHAAPCIALDIGLSFLLVARSRRPEHHGHDPVDDAMAMAMRMMPPAASGRSIVGNRIITGQIYQMLLPGSSIAARCKGKAKANSGQCKPPRSIVVHPAASFDRQL